MAEVTIIEIRDGIRDTLEDATGVIRAQAGSGTTGITEGVQGADMPLVQVYWERSYAEEEETRYATYGGHVQTTVHEFHADVYAAQRSHIGENLQQVDTMASAIIVALQAERTAPLFGVTDDGDEAAVKAFSWTADRSSFIYGAPETPYPGIRFVIRVWVF